MSYGGGFWATIEHLAALEGQREEKQDVQDWLETVNKKMKLQQKRGEFLNGNAQQKDREINEDAVSYRNLIDCSFSYPAVRTRLEMLMGSNVVRLTDRRYMLKLMARIREDLENQQQIRVDERKTKELMRTKKMILDRLIPVQDAPPELKKYPLFQLYLHCDAIIENKRNKRLPKKVKVTASLYQMLYPEGATDEQENEDNEDEKYMKTIYLDGVPQMIPMTLEEISAMRRGNEHDEDMKEGNILTQEDYDRLHYETDAVKELRKIQTVEEMYAKAHEIVGILYSYADEGRYKKAKDTESAVTEVANDIISVSTSEPQPEIEHGVQQ